MSRGSLHIADLKRDRDYWKGRAQKWEAHADKCHELCRKQALHIKELEAIAHEAVGVAVGGLDPEDPR